MSKRVVVGTPVFDGKLEVDHVIATQGTLALCNKNAIQIDFLYLANESILPLARNKLLGEAWRRGVDDIIWIDADIAWEPSSILRLISHEVDFVAVPCRKKNPLALKFNFEHIGFIPDDKGLLKVRRVGTGFCRMSKKIITHLMEKSKKLDLPSGPVPNAFEYTISGREYLSEDFTVCDKLSSAGFDLYIDTQIPCAHLGGFPYAGNVSQYLTQLAQPDKK